MRGQLVSIDLVIAAALLAFSIGAAMQLNEAAQRAAANPSAGSAEAIADLAQAGSNLSQYPLPAHCVSYSNGTGDCGGFQCAGGTDAANRLAQCADGTCLMRVVACR
jgi:hypothetical protein